MGFVVYGKMDKMATEVYIKDNIYLINGMQLEIIPLKILYLREFMSEFDKIKQASNDDEAIDLLTECVRISMKQYYPELSHSKDLVEENFDLPTIYKIIDIAAGIKIKESSSETVQEQATNKGESWHDLDLAKLETEIFMLGIWKDYYELERSLSMPELIMTLSNKRELDYEERKFLAAIQGVDLDASSESGRGQKEWEDLKARVFSRGKATDSRDVLSLQGQNAKKAGFGIGLGLDYEDLRN